MTVRALRIAATPNKDEPVVYVAPTDGGSMATFLGTGTPRNVEGTHFGIPWRIYYDPRSRINGGRPNYTATVLARQLGWGPIDWFFIGHIVFTGVDKVNQDADVPITVIGEAFRLDLINDTTWGRLLKEAREPIRGGSRFSRHDDVPNVPDVPDTPPARRRPPGETP